VKKEKECKINFTLLYSFFYELTKHKLV
jgi:hypothetical protein